MNRHDVITLREKLAGRRIIASISGGKDSAAMALYLRELGLEDQVERVFLDTGWEHPTTYEYLHGPLTAALGPIRDVRAPLGMADLCREKGMFPSRRRRWCTDELKVKPMQRYLRTLDFDHINAVGIRAGESLARSKLPEWEWSEGFDCEVWRPLISWSEQDVIDIHTRHGLRPNPLYLRGAERVGCFPCIFARKAELRWMADHHPERVAEIEALEREVGDAAEARWRAKGSSLEAEGYTRPTMFQAKLPDPDGSYPCWPISRVIEWARTKRGGREPELFDAADEDAGCMRWGLCEVRGADISDLL